MGTATLPKLALKCAFPVEAHSKIDGDCDFSRMLTCQLCFVEAHSKIDGDCDNSSIFRVMKYNSLKRIPKLMGTATAYATTGAVSAMC